MSEYKENWKGYSGMSYGLEYPIRFGMQSLKDEWVVYNFKTGKVYERGLKQWEASSRCLEELEKLGFSCRPDIAAIDSTP